MSEESSNSKKKIKIMIAVIVFILVAALVVLFLRSRITATTMRILRLEGEVTLEDNGKPKTITENLRLNSGNALATAIQSLVSIGLDDTKIVTLDEKSRAIFEQSGRKLELNLTDGSLFFEVSKPLTDEETFDISTSTMVVGIRGTSGWVSVDGEHESLIITDGVVHVIGTNPTTGEVKEIDVRAGQRINVYLYNDRAIDSIMFELVEVTERELPEFLLERLREDSDLLDKVCRETGWDKPWILGQVDDEMPVISLNDETPPDGPDDDDDGGDLQPEVPDAEENTTNPGSDIDPEHPEGATLSERRAARAQIIFTDVNTGVVALKDGTLFDPAFYAETNPDVVEKYGTDTDALLAHWLKRGRRQGRPPIAPPTPTPTQTPSWVNTETIEEPEDSDDSEEEDNKNVSTGNVVTFPPGTYPMEINGPNSTFTFDDTTQTLTGGNDEQYIRLPLTVNWTDAGGVKQSKTFNTVDDITFDPNTSSVTSGNISKDSWGRYLDLSAVASHPDSATVKLPDLGFTYNLGGGAGPTNFSYKNSSGNTVNYDVDLLGKINWATSEDNVAVTNNNYTVKRISSTEYVLTDPASTPQTFHDAATLQSYLKNNNL